MFFLTKIDFSNFCIFWGFNFFEKFFFQDFVLQALEKNFFSKKMKALTLSFHTHLQVLKNIKNWLF
jgi:hypothetical protein